MSYQERHPDMGLETMQALSSIFNDFKDIRDMREARNAFRQDKSSEPAN